VPSGVSLIPPKKKKSAKGCGIEELREGKKETRNKKQKETREKGGE
jgi:hypothetical protein